VKTKRDGSMHNVNRNSKCNKKTSMSSFAKNKTDGSRYNVSRNPKCNKETSRSKV
jgi:hypothetical protein